MKILQIHNDYLLPGGETSSVKKIGSLLEENGHQVVKYWHDNRDLEHPGLSRRMRFAADLAYNSTARRQVKAAAAGVEIVHVHNLFPVISPSALYGARDARKPIVMHLQNYRLFCANGLMVLNGKIHDECLRGDYRCSVFHGCQKGSNLLGMLYALSLSVHKALGSFELPDQFIAISNAVKDIFIRFGIPSSKITVLHHFVDTSLYESGQEDEGFYIYIGRLSREKGVRTLVEAFAERPDLKLMVVGDGPDRTLLELKARESKAENIAFLGHRERAEWSRRLPRARALILPSECYETFGLAALEALACGVPVIGARIGGIVDIVQEGETGLLFASGSKSELLSCIHRFETMSALDRARLRSNARESAIMRFNKDDYFRKLMDVYDLARSGS